MADARNIQQVADIGSAILDELERAVVGKRDVLDLLLTGLLADGHLLFEDVPGLAKTLIARSFAQVADMSFSRVQFTPDLVPGDITGSMIFDPGTGSGLFQPGPVFANLVLGDEINRAPPKTQAACRRDQPRPSIAAAVTTSRSEMADDHAAKINKGSATQSNQETDLFDVTGGTFTNLHNGTATAATILR